MIEGTTDLTNNTNNTNKIDEIDKIDKVDKTDKTENISFNTHHSAFGAYSSFVVGELGKGGGFVINDVKPPEANLYIGYKTVEEIVRVMPFFNLEEYDYGQQFGFEIKDNGEWTNLIKPFNAFELSRELKAASDSWTSGAFTFKIFTPFTNVPDPKECDKTTFKQYCNPAILLELALDNTLGPQDATLFFGMDKMGRLIGDHSDKLAGGASARLYGFAALKEEVEEDIGFNSLKYVAKGKKANYRLGCEALVSMKVAAGEKKTLTLALATFQDGVVTSGLDCRFAYTDYFKNLEDVLLFTLENKNYYKALCNKKDMEIEQSGLNKWRKNLLSQAIHSYYANSELLIRDNGKFLWVVNEGQYRMMNTLDLTVDHLFFELKYHPWAVKNVMQFFRERYSYTMDIKAPDGSFAAGGISFCHDCGVANMFSKPGTSAYEFMHDEGCFSFMTMEELLNWTLCSCLYGVKHGDTKWLLEHKQDLIACLQSILVRDKNGDGVMDSDCVGCGAAYEITTYDSLDKSLSHARNNLYMAVKTFGTSLCLRKALELAGENTYAQQCEELASRTAKTVSGYYLREEKYIPAVFEGEEASRIIPAIEGLIYPYFIGDVNAVSSDGRYGEFINKLKIHFNTVMVPGVCIEPKSRGWRLSSTSVNTWMSKIFLSQFISEKVLGFEQDDQTLAADQAHSLWQFEGCASLCAVDQVSCEEGSPIGSRLYPRLVTSILWLD